MPVFIWRNLTPAAILACLEYIVAKPQRRASTEDGATPRHQGKANGATGETDPRP